MRGLMICLAIGLIICGAAARRPTPVFAAVVETANFRIECYDAGLAREVALAAEACRTELWQYWLGTAPPAAWAYKCEVTVRVTQSDGGGSTSMCFERGEAFGFEGTWEGRRERILDCVVPHEVSHTVLATHFRRPLPRAIDEGMCSAVEADAGRDNWRREILAVLSGGRSSPLAALLAMTEYPADYAALYAQGASLVEFLLAMGRPSELVRCVELAGPQGAWPAALKTVYGFEDLTHLQESWLAWLRAGGGRVSVGYGEPPCYIDANGNKICPKSIQGAQWRSVPRQQFNPPAQQAAPQRQPLVPRTFAGVKVEGPRGASVAVGATRTPAGPTTAAATTAAAKPCACAPKFAAVEKRLDAIDEQLAAIAAREPPSPDLSGYVRASDLPAPPSIDHLATRDELAAAAQAAAQQNQSIVERLAAVAQVAAGAAARGGLLEGVGVGGLAAGVGGPIGLGLVVGAWLLKRRLKKRLGAGGRSDRVFHDEQE